MIRIFDISGKWFFGCALALAALAPAGIVRAQSKEIVLYSFQGGSDGSVPSGRLIADANGNLYGTTSSGGVDGDGTVFKLAPDGTETILHTFAGGADGAEPQAGLIVDQAGNLYGTTSSGGGGAANAGTVFEVTPDGTETVLYSFCSQTKCADGGGPGGLVMDEQGNLYGAASYGGRKAHGRAPCRSYGCGVVFKLAPGGIETVIYAFKGLSDGAGPDALIMDGLGNLYGTTAEGGSHSQACREMAGKHVGCGTIFEIASNGTEKILYDFCSRPNCADGWNPAANLIMDDNGNLYGPTCCAVAGTVVFKLAPSGEETAVHTFNGPPDGVSPLGGLAVDKKGNLYGATLQGGSGTGCQGQIGCGMVFKLAPDGTESILYSFESGGGTDGFFPHGGVIIDKAGDLFGTTGYGGSHGDGTIFEIKK